MLKAKPKHDEIVLYSTPMTGRSKIKQAKKIPGVCQGLNPTCCFIIVIISSCFGFPFVKGTIIDSRQIFASDSQFKQSSFLFRQIIGNVNFTRRPLMLKAKTVPYC